MILICENISPFEQGGFLIDAPGEITHAHPWTLALTGARMLAFKNAILHF